MSMFLRNYATGGYERRSLRVGDVAATRIAILLSLIFGACVGLFGVVALVQYTRIAMRRKATADRVKAKVMPMQLAQEAGEGEVEEGTEDEAKAREEEVSKPGFNPFERPLDLVDLLVVNPVRRRFTNSLLKFVRERCRVVPPHTVGRGAGGEDRPHDSGARVAPQPLEGDAAPAAPRLPTLLMSELQRKYSLFCFSNDLVEITSENEIRKLLIEKFDLRVSRRRVQHVLGARWRPEYRVLLEGVSRETPGPNWDALCRELGPKPEEEWSPNVAARVLKVRARSVCAGFARWPPPRGPYHPLHRVPPQAFLENFCETEGAATEKLPLRDETRRRRQRDQEAGKTNQAASGKRPPSPTGEAKSEAVEPSAVGMALEPEVVNLGFRSRFEDFCEALGWKDVEAPAGAYSMAGVTLVDRTESTVRGLGLLDFSSGAKARLSRKFYALEFFTVRLRR